MWFPTKTPSSTKHGPFDVIIMMSPDIQAARAVQDLMVSFTETLPFSSLPLPAAVGASSSAPENSHLTAIRSANGTIFISSCHPYGCRMGTGGGTIAALAEADEVYRQWKGEHQSWPSTATESSDTPPTVLICHAGGESSRFPTQIVRGTTWASVPIGQRNESQSIGDSEGKPSPSTHCGNGQPSFSPITTNPISLLLSSLSDAFNDVPRGSVVVVADSDILLSFQNDYSPIKMQKKINFHGLQDNGSVIGLAVPAPVETIKNRRVHMLENISQQSVVHEKYWQVQPTFELLHNIRPEQWAGTIDLNEITRSPQFNTGPINCTFYLADQPSRKMAWVDTGVVAFLPDASGTLRDSTLKSWTKSGLKEMYENKYGIGRCADETAPSLEEFARNTSRKICLYDNMLHALSTSSSGLAGLGLLEVHPEKLLNHKLYTCTIPTGSLVHFGSTGLNVSDVRGMGPTHRFNSFVSGFELENTKHSIMLNSLLESGDVRDSTIGKGSVLEDCRLECAYGIMIGERCLLSRIREPVKGSSFHVPSGTCLQLLPLHQSRNQTEPSLTENNEGTHGYSFVCICLGVDDDIGNAPPKTLYGLDLKHILPKSELVEDDLWDASIPPSKRTLWNAKINPVLSVNSDGAPLDFSFLDWISCLKETFVKLDGGYLTKSAILGAFQWRAARRLSLAQIGASVDSISEDRRRSYIPPHMGPIGEL